MSSIVDLRGDEEIEVSLLRKIDERIRETSSSIKYRQNKYNFYSERKGPSLQTWGKLDDLVMQDPGAAADSSHQPQGFPNHNKSNYPEVRRTLRWNDYTALAPDEEVSIRPHYLFEAIRPWVRDFVKSYLSEFKVTIMQSISQQVRELLISAKLNDYSGSLVHEVANIKQRIVN